MSSGLKERSYALETRIDPGLQVRVRECTRFPRPAICAAAMLTLGIASAGCTDSMTEPLPATAAAARDRAAIEALYHATEGPEWVQQDNWLTDAPLSDWHRVVTDSVGRVVWLTLPGNRLTGTLPPELGDLTELQHLWLSDNALRGPIPTRLGDLTQLAGLYLQDNRLTGFIPEIFLELEHLRAFHFGGNLGLCIPGTAARSWPVLNATPAPQRL